MKEALPTPTGPIWYQEGSNASQRLLAEAYFMKELFDIRQPKLVKLPPSSWDTKEMTLTTHLLRLHSINDPAFTLGWDIQFSMDDRGRLCKPNQVWTTKIFYPTTYPSARPLVSLLDDKGYMTHPDAHILGNPSIAGTNYLDLCVLHGSHDPGRMSGSFYGLRAIIYLRIYLQSKKTGKPMSNFFYG